MAGLRRLGSSLVALALVVGCSDSGSAPPERKTSSAQPVPSPHPAGRTSTEQTGSWQPVAPPPIPPVAGAASAWTGRHLVAWGGGSGSVSEDDSGNWHPSAAGAAYDPAADRWEVLPPAPIPGRLGATAVWTGREVLFWGGAAGHDRFFADGAAYDPTTRRWRALPPAPLIPRTDHQATWTGKEMFVWGGISRCCPVNSELHVPSAAAYDPATNLWRRMPDVPDPWSGDDGTAVTLTDGGRPLIWRRGHLGSTTTAPDAADVWGNVPGMQPVPLQPDPMLPASTGDPFAMATVVDGEVFTWTGRAGQLHGMAWRRSDSSWRRTATLEAQSGGAIAAGDDGHIYAAAGQSARVLRYSIAEDRWTELPLPPIPTRSAAILTWTGDDLLVWGGIGDESPEMDGAIWHCC
ncbi:MAG TPA: hypothetical protein VEG38_09605 [Acidimicrobiia bacterium]|nr:hypothetical protein [Acidimicrobiia bacterium]